MAYIGAGISRFNTADELTVTGDAEFNGNVTLGDSDIAQFGAGTDLQILSNGSAALIKNGNATSDIRLESDNRVVICDRNFNEAFAIFNDDDDVKLFHNGSEKLATTSTGIDVTGTVTADGLTVNSGTIDLATIIQSSDSNVRLKLIDGDASNGVFLAGKGENLAFETNGNNERMRIDSSGNVGINETSPTGGRLVVAQANSVQPAIHLPTDESTIQGPNTDTQIKMGGNLTLQSGGVTTIRAKDASGRIDFRTGSTPTERMRIDTSGNVGIGTSSPDSKLTIANTTQWHDGLQIRRDSPSDQYLALGYDIGAAYIIAVDETPASAGDGQTTVFGYSSNGTSFTESMRIDSSGNVGIGQTNPSGVNVGCDDLVIGDASGNRGLTILSGATSLGLITFNDGVNTSRTGGFEYDHSSNYLAFRTSDSEAARIDSSGNLLVGLTSISDATSRTYGNAFSGTNANANWKSWGSGSHTHAQFRNGTSAVGSITTTASGTTYNTTSDRRLKTDIQPIEHATDMLMAMKPVTHRWKADPDADAVVGFIAQEMQEVVPEAVSGEDGGEEMMSMDYGRITPVLVAALQDAHRKIDQLEQRIAEMENN